MDVKEKLSIQIKLNFSGTKEEINAKVKALQILADVVDAETLKKLSWVCVNDKSTFDFAKQFLSENK